MITEQFQHPAQYSAARLQSSAFLIFIPLIASASGRFGVIHVASGRICFRIAATAESCISLFPLVEIMTGSTTSSPRKPVSARATAIMIGRENSIPVLIAEISSSLRTVRIWSSTADALTGSIPATQSGFCEVSAVIAEQPNTRKKVKVLRSA